jgi:hypothetical protein
MQILQHLGAFRSNLKVLQQPSQMDTDTLYDSPSELVSFNLHMPQRSTHELFTLLQQQMKRQKTYVACYGTDRQEKCLYVFDFHTSQLVRKIHQRESPTRLYFIDKHQLAVVERNETKIIDVTKNQTVFDIQYKGEDPPYTIICVGKYLVYDLYHKINVCNVDTNTTQAEEVTKMYELMAIDSSRFVTCESNGNITIWRIQPLTRLASMKMSEPSLYSVDRWSTTELVCAGRGNVQIWNFETQTLVDTIALNNSNRITAVRKVRNKILVCLFDHSQARLVAYPSMEIGLCKVEHTHYTFRPVVCKGASTVLSIHQGGNPDL